MIVEKPSFEFIGEVDGIKLLKKLERIARVCYKSEGNITDDSYKRMIEVLRDRGHEAMLEHDIISALCTCDRGVSHELVRHRIASFAQSSTRYCNYSKNKFNNQITYIDITGGIALDPVCSVLPIEIQAAIIDEWIDACKDAEAHYMKMIDLGASAQIARSVLNNSTKTEIVISTNPREWRHFFKLRYLGTTGAPHPQMKELTSIGIEKFKKEIPLLFDDIGDTNG